MGEIPDREVFFQPGLEKELHPYFLLARAVRLGDLEAYNKAVAANAAQFARDETQSLVVRLRHNVIKTGLRKINAAYSRIGFADICEKLRLESPKDAEYIVAKAIRDGTLEATIEHGQYMQSRATTNTYATSEPYAQFHKRVEFCIQIRNDAVKAMRFPDTQEVSDVLKDNEEKKATDAAADVDESAALDELDEED
jgi:26S proteasome regulatory subunit N3